MAGAVPGRGSGGRLQAGEQGRAGLGWKSDHVILTRALRRQDLKDGFGKVVQDKEV
ncbi:hypothetical protein [Catenuloplanes niger]|uniref:Uncharacterized protein n=1 Tax=Catenuloplanes niger TaxID=587534 RepID=A0AAE4CVV7_9ACTN|nr:hypothetical protein [Catenuloplanes niger]MDR7327836.1 hypothetical protein [Catenuloplanes niger]